MSKRLIAGMVGRLNVIGSARATAIGAFRPGMAPKRLPMATPAKMSAKF